MKKVLITGGTGLIGTELCHFLKGKGYTPVILSRNPLSGKEFRQYKWNVDKKEIDPEALDGTEYIIHLAGENLGAKRWTKARKQKLIDSRVKSTEFLFDTIKNGNYNIKAFISASAVGIYPTFREGEEYYIEDDMYGNSFAAEICKKWESAADKFKSAGIRTVKIRTGLVQHPKDPALKKILRTVKFGVLPVFGKGKHYYPWIHINDLCNIYYTALENENFNDPFNAVAPDYITNAHYISAVKKARNNKGAIIKIPAFALKLMFGEMSEIILRGTLVHSKLHKDIEFEFQYPTIDGAMENLIGGK